MRFSDATPSLTDLARRYVDGASKNATQLAEKARICSSNIFHDEQAVTKATDALTYAFQPGRRLSLLAALVVVLAFCRFFAIRATVRRDLHLHSKLD